MSGFLNYVRKLVAAVILGAAFALTASTALGHEASGRENAICKGYHYGGDTYVMELWTRRVACSTARAVTRQFVSTRASTITSGGVQFRCGNDDFGEGAALASCRGSGGRYISFHYGML